MKLYRQQHALIIGISKYADGEVPQLRTAEKDARNLVAFLQKEFVFDDIKTLCNEQATRDAIEEQLYSYQKLKEEDALFIYYGGHAEVARGVGYFIPYDGEVTAGRRNLLMSTLKPIFTNIIPARHILLTIASCFSGEFLLARSASPEAVYRDVKRMKEEAPAEYENRLTANTRMPARQVLTAGSSGEKMQDNWSESDLSPFAQLLIDGLKGGGDYVEADELAANVRRRMKQLIEAKMIGCIHTPQFSDMMYQGQGSFVFQRRWGRNKQKEIVITEQSAPEAETIQVRRREIRGTLVVDFEAGSELFLDDVSFGEVKEGEQLELDVRIGEHLMELRKGGKKQRQTVKVSKSAGGQVAFGEWPKPAPPKPPEPKPVSTHIKKPAVTLRRAPRSLSRDEVIAMLKEYSFYDITKNKKGKGFSNEYEARNIDGDKVVIDHATGLMWQQGGSDKYMKYEDAKKWLADL
ncbi:caspase family protein, partial [candidate division KSB1 bacterium]|nr:caspase family protein [candidate division KSB1 bacterium]